MRQTGRPQLLRRLWAGKGQKCGHVLEPCPHAAHLYLLLRVFFKFFSLCSHQNVRVCGLKVRLCGDLGEKLLAATL